MSFLFNNYQKPNEWTAKRDVFDIKFSRPTGRSANENLYTMTTD